MNPGKFLLGLAIWLVVQIGVSQAQQDDVQVSPQPAEGKYRIEMVGGTIVFGTTNLNKIELDIEFDQVSIPISRIRTIKLIGGTEVNQDLKVKVNQNAEPRFVVELVNNDRFSGKILNSPFDLLCLGGKVTLPFAELKSLQSLSTDAAAEVSVNEGPIFHFAFEGSSPIIAKNKVDDKLHLLLNGAQRVVKSKVRKGIKLDGSTTMTIPHDLALCPKKLTLAAWIKPTGKRNNYAFIAGKSTPSNWNSGFAFAYMSADPDHVHFYVNGYQQQIVKAVVKGDEWSHLVGTCDGKSVVLYLNGEQVQKIPYPDGQPVQHTTQPFSIGGDPTNYHWTGEIDEVAMYNHALSPAQVRQLYNQHILP